MNTSEPAIACESAAGATLRRLMERLSRVLGTRTQGTCRAELGRLTTMDDFCKTIGRSISCSPEGTVLHYVEYNNFARWQEGLTTLLCMLIVAVSAPL